MTRKCSLFVLKLNFKSIYRCFNLFDDDGNLKFLTQLMFNRKIVLYKELEKLCDKYGTDKSYK